LENISEAITRRLRDFCAEHKITQTALAKSIGLTQAAVQKWFDLGKKTLPDLLTLYYISEEYGLDINWLVFGEEHKKYKQASTKDCSDCIFPSTVKMLTDELAEKMKIVTQYQKEKNERMVDEYKTYKLLERL
jgi:predicted transcriptional regulator